MVKDRISLTIRDMDDIRADRVSEYIQAKSLSSRKELVKAIKKEFKGTGLGMNPEDTADRMIRLVGKQRRLPSEQMQILKKPLRTSIEEVDVKIYTKTVKKYRYKKGTILNGVSVGGRFAPKE